MRREGAELALTYQNEKLQERVEKMAAELGSTITLPCELSEDAEITRTFEQLSERWSHLDSIVHSAAYTFRSELEGPYIDAVTREGFRVAHDISSYSFTALAKAGRKMMQGRNGALLTLSYLGSERVVPNYNVMGLAKASLEANVRYMADSLGPEGTRVNAVSAGPIKTLAASGISGFNRILDHMEKNAPLRRNVTVEEVGNAAAFLCSDLASGITGEVVYVDSGYHIIGMGPL
jgi:enoyl-[acyl-carrier protein] reductase I